MIPFCFAGTLREIAEHGSINISSKESTIFKKGGYCDEKVETNDRQRVGSSNGSEDIRVDELVTS